MIWKYYGINKVFFQVLLLPFYFKILTSWRPGFEIYFKNSRNQSFKITIHLDMTFWHKGGQNNWLKLWNVSVIMENIALGKFHKQQVFAADLFTRQQIRISGSNASLNFEPWRHPLTVFAIVEGGEKYS